MSSTAAPASCPPRCIRSARSLFEALRAPDPLERLETLRAIQKEPAVALSFGIFEGRDVIDVLIRESHRSAGTSEWMQWLGTLNCFADPRVRDFFFGVLCDRDEPTVIFAAARYLARAPVASLPESIYDLLLSDNNPMRARAAAVVLANVQTTGMRARIRLALLSAGKVHIPRLAPDNLAVWLEELKGAFRLEAMSALEAQGEQTWIQLAFAWNEAGPELRTWLLQWGFRDFLPMLPSLLPQALRDSDRTVVLEGVRAMADAGERIVPESIRGLAGTFLSDPDPALREAAVAAAPPGIDWREFLASETNCAVRFAAIAQLARTECEHAIPDLIQFLRSSDWQARAVAAGCLITLGTAAVDAVKPLVRDADQNVRTAAVRILIAFQQDAWLEKELLI